jgi:antitoxin VapB
MTNMAGNRVKEAAQTFKAAGKSAPLVPCPGEYRAKVFKSGNSLALRLPASLGLKEGSEMLIREVPGGYALEPVEPPKRKLDISGFWGKAKGLKVPERRDFDERPSTIAARLAKHTT